MKRLITITALFVLTATPAYAETVRTCSSVYGGGEVCGESTTNITVEHTIVDAGVGGTSIWQVIAMIGGAAAVATILYKISYKWYVLG